LRVFLERADKLIRFSATGASATREKVGSSARREKERERERERDALCSGVDTTEGTNERRKEGRKEGREAAEREARWRAEDRGIYCESRAPAREVSEVARISRLEADEGGG